MNEWTHEWMNERTDTRTISIYLSIHLSCYLLAYPRMRVSSFYSHHRRHLLYSLPRFVVSAFRWLPPPVPLVFCHRHRTWWEEIVFDGFLQLKQGWLVSKLLLFRRERRTKKQGAQGLFTLFVSFSFSELVRMIWLTLIGSQEKRNDAKPMDQYQ